MSYCSNCGKELKVEYKFCPKCGTVVSLSEVCKEKNDSLYDEVLKFVIKNERVSVSLIQKEFALSYSKALSIMKELEENKVVGPSSGSKGREVLLKELNVSNELNSDATPKRDDLENKFKKFFNNIMDTEDNTSSFDENDIKENIILSVLSYLGLLVFIPYFMSNNSKYVKYHAIQGMNLLIVWGIYTLFDNLLSLIKVSKVVIDFGSMVGTKMVTPLWISLPMSLFGLLLFVISIIGIVYAAKGKAKELPIINKIKIVK